MRPEPFRKWTRPFRLRQRLSAHLPKIDGARRRLVIATRGAPWGLVEFRKHGRHITLNLSREFIADERVHFDYRTRLPVAVHVFSRTAAAVVAALAELNDKSTIKSDQMTFCSTQPDALLIPDPEFFNSNGYQHMRDMLSGQRPWSTRSEEIVWRGATTGEGQFPDGSLDLHATEVR